MSKVLKLVSRSARLAEELKIEIEARGYDLVLTEEGDEVRCTLFVGPEKVFSAWADDYREAVCRVAWLVVASERKRREPRVAY